MADRALRKQVRGRQANDGFLCRKVCAWLPRRAAGMPSWPARVSERPSLGAEAAHS